MCVGLDGPELAPGCAGKSELELDRPVGGGDRRFEVADLAAEYDRRSANRCRRGGGVQAHRRQDRQPQRAAVGTGEGSVASEISLDVAVGGEMRE